MKRSRSYTDSWIAERQHKAKVIAKAQRIAGLRALIETWESEPYCDHTYLLDLRRRLRNAENQLTAMEGI